MELDSQNPKDAGAIARLYFESARAANPTPPVSEPPFAEAFVGEAQFYRLVPGWDRFEASARS